MGLGRFVARADALLARRLPKDVSSEVQYRARVLVALIAIFNVVLLTTTPIDVASGAWGAVALQIGSLVVVDLLLVRALARGKVAAMGHFVSALLVVNLTLMAQEKGGLLATEVAWQCAAILFATLVVGPRGALAWTCAAIGSLAIHVHLFDPTQWHGRASSFVNKVGFGVDIALLYLATWGLAFAFDRARAKFLGRLEGRNAEMRRVLDHVGDALLTIDREGRLGEERSASADSLLGAPRRGAHLWDVLAADPANAQATALLQMSWEAILDDMLPREVALEQTPKRVAFRGRTLDLRLRLIEGGDGQVQGGLVVLQDVTEELAREDAERAGRELLAVFQHVRTDPGAVADFASEIDRLVASAASTTDGQVVMRDIHTIKGNAALFGLEGLASLCHAIEQRCAEAELSLPVPADRALLAERWSEISSKLREWSGALDGDRRVAVTGRDLGELRATIASGASAAELDALVAAWELTPAERVLARLARQGETLAEKLEKDVDFRVEVEPPALRVDTAALAPVLSSLVHAIRNAIDHGIADPDVRAASGKSPRGTITLRAVQSDELVLAIADDGEGVPWEAVRRKAAARGLPASTDAQLMNALLSDGFSTRDEATATSGRGVGLAGIRQAAEALGGKLRIVSEPARGSRIEVRLPSAAAPADRPAVAA